MFRIGVDRFCEFGLAQNLDDVLYDKNRIDWLYGRMTVYFVSAAIFICHDSQKLHQDPTFLLFLSPNALATIYWLKDGLMASQRVC